MTSDGSAWLSRRNSTIALLFVHRFTFWHVPFTHVVRQLVRHFTVSVCALLLSVGITCVLHEAIMMF